MPGLPLVGGCSCGALRYELRAPPFMVYNCHCTNCQKISGSAFNISVTIAEASLVFTAGEPAKFVWKSDAGNTRCGLFCRACGSRIANAMSPSNGVLSLRGGTLDDASWLEPVGDIWVKSKQPWVTIPAGRIQIERGPTDYAPFIEKFKEQGRF
ncbi:MAG: GFA family protein [Hyphomonadaceae bacterium]